MKTLKTDVVVLGAGPGGYAAAFYAADLGKKVTLIEQEALGGVCLNWGCIPSKALLHAVEILENAKKASKFGISFSEPKVDLDQLRSWKQDIVKKLSGGIKMIAKKRGVDVISGRALFDSATTLRIETEAGNQFLEFENAIIAVGSRPAIPAAFDLGNKRIMTSTEALDVEDVPKELLVVGGGIIGMELGTVYAGLGSKVVLVEAADRVLAGADPDLVRPVSKYAKAHFKDVRLSAKVQKMATDGKKIKVKMEAGGKSVEEKYDKVLVSVGRTPNSDDLGLDNTSIKTDDRGFIEVDAQCRTAESHIFAIGDIVGGAMLAHKASKEARIAVEVMTGAADKAQTKDVVIPSVVFTHPEVAWAGLTETEAKAQGKKVKIAKFPWGACGRAMTLDNTDGLTKLILEPETDRVLGVGIAGPSAGDLISEGVLAIEMGCTAQDLAETVHPHPTLSETMMEAAEAHYGHSSHTV